MIFGREPARWIGLIVALILAIVRVLAGDSLISPDQADTVTNLTQKVADVLYLIAPLIVGELIRTQVTPTAAPKLPNGTEVAVTSVNDGAVIERKVL